MAGQRVYTGRARRKETRWGVRAMDVVSRWVITIGGIGTVVAVTTVFLLLLWVVFPLLLPARVEGPGSMPTEGTARILRVGVDDYRSTVWLLRSDDSLVARAFDSGVSLKSKIPLWEELIRGMVLKMDGGSQEMYEALRGKGMSLTAIASLLEERTQGGRKKFVEDVRKALYQQFPYHPNGVTKSNHARYVKFIEQGVLETEAGSQEAEPNHTLHSVGAFCTVWRQPKTEGGSPFFVNPKVNAVVTLNMDALLQSYVYARTRKHLLRTVERPSARRYSDRINVYHIHGYLHFDTRHEDLSRDKPLKEKRLRDAPLSHVVSQPSQL